LSNLTQLLEPVEPQDDLPGEIPIERLAAPDVAPASYGPGGRDTWVRERVQAKCFAPAEPEMRVRHPVHILQHMDGEPDVSDEEEEDEDVTVPRSWPGRKIAVVEIPTVKRGMNRAPRVADQSLVEATSDDVEDEWEDVDDTQLDEGILKEEVWINGDMEDDSEGLKDDDGAEVVVDEDDDGAEAVPTDGPLNLERVEVEEVVNVTAGHVDDGYIADALSVDSPTPNLAQPIINEATMTDVPLNVERAMEEAVVNVTAGPIDATALAADPLIPDLALPVVSEVAPAEAQQNAELAPGESVTVSAAMPNLALATATPNHHRLQQSRSRWLSQMTTIS
jgi:hypothetical protein